MATFIDAAGNEWNVEIDVETIRRVRKETGFAFGTCLNDDMQSYYSMIEDYELMPSVMHAILEPAIKSDGISKDTFLNNVKGEAIESAQIAIWDAFAFFCPPRQRQLLQEIKTATETMSEEQLKKATELMETYTANASSTEQSSESSQVRIASES